LKIPPGIDPAPAPAPDDAAALARLRRHEFVSSWIAEGREIERHGTRATAQVLTVERTSTIVNGDPMVLADIAVQVAPTPYTVAMNVIVPADEPDRLRIGDLVDVRFDPRTPARVVLCDARLIGIFFH